MAPSPSDQYTDFLARKSKKLTKHATRVVDAAFSMCGTFSCDDILGRLEGKVSRATVYRELMLLTEAQLLRKVQFNGQQVYVASSPPDGDT